MTMSLTPQAQRVRNATETSSTTPKSLIKSGNWSRCFPTKFSTETSSCVFVKKLVTVAVSNIAYLRSMFPEMAYANRSLDGMQLKILRGKNECPEAQSLARWLMGAFDALEKKYLRELMLVVYKDPSNPDIVEELYTFRYSHRYVVYTFLILFLLILGSATLTDRRPVSFCREEMARR